MATRAANKRLAREYLAIQKNPPPYIQAHPSECNILEWHYIITGPEDTPYEGGQYWGTLVFPPDYPYKPPAIRMMTPSGRFQTSTRLCLSISDFHPKSFNPAWEVSTILIGLLSFMTSEEMTTGSISATEAERKLLAQRTRWWNCSGGGSGVLDPSTGQVAPNTSGNGPTGRGVGWGDMGNRFRSEWPEVDHENWDWVHEKRINPATGIVMPVAAAAVATGVSRNASGIDAGGVNGQETSVRRRPVPGAASVPASTAAAGVVVKRGESWARRHKVLVGAIVLLVYVFVVRVLE